MQKLIIIGCCTVCQKIDEVTSVISMGWKLTLTSAHSSGEESGQ